MANVGILGGNYSPDDAPIWVWQFGSVSTTQLSFMDHVTSDTTLIGFSKK